MKYKGSSLIQLSSVPTTSCYWEYNENTVCHSKKIIIWCSKENGIKDFSVLTLYQGWVLLKTVPHPISSQRLCKTTVTKLRSSEMASMFSIDRGGNQSLHHLLSKAMWPPYCKQSLLQADSALSPSWWLGPWLTSRKVHSRRFHFSLSHPTVHGLQMHFRNGNWGWRDAQ